MVRLVAGEKRIVQCAAVRKDGWTKARRAGFFAMLSATCNVRASAAAMGMTDCGAYYLRRRDPVFAAQWQEALAEGYGRLEQGLMALALEGIRKFKTTDGAFVWAPSLAAGQPATLLGYPVVEAEDMPDIAANALAIAFGNFKAGYLITERAETGILRDPYSNKPFVSFYATKRVGGCVTNSEAIKLMKFSVA